MITTRSVNSTWGLKKPGINKLQQCRAGLEFVFPCMIGVACSVCITLCTISSLRCTVENVKMFFLKSNLFLEIHPESNMKTIASNSISEWFLFSAAGKSRRTCASSSQNQFLCPGNWRKSKWNRGKLQTGICKVVDLDVQSCPLWYLLFVTSYMMLSIMVVILNIRGWGGPWKIDHSFVCVGIQILAESERA